MYQLEAERLTPLKGRTPGPIAPGSRASLVLVHGTFSNTAGTFGHLWAEHPQSVGALFNAYGNSVYGLDHPTLGASPIAKSHTR